MTGIRTSVLALVAAAAASPAQAGHATADLPVHRDTGFSVRVQSPVPEPGSLMLLGVGLAGMVLTRRRQPQR